MPFLWFILFEFWIIIFFLSLFLAKYFGCGKFLYGAKMAQGYSRVMMGSKHAKGGFLNNVVTHNAKNSATDTKSFNWALVAY